MNRWIGLLVVFVVVGTLVAPDSAIDAQGQNTIQVVSDDVTIDYPYALSFAVSAASSMGRITSIRLFWRGGPEEVYNVRPLRFTPSRAVSVNYPVNAQFLSLPPFAKLSYRWQIRDEHGNELTTENRTIEFEDTRHDWQEIQGERLRLRYYNLDEAFASELFTHAEEAYVRLADAFGVELTETPSVLIYPDRQSFLEIQGLLRNSEFVIGRYFPGHNITVNLVTEDMAPELYETTIAHELSHLYSDNYYVGFARIPLWLEEGLATFNETDGVAEPLLRVQAAAAQDELVPMIELPGAIRSREVSTTNLAYAEGATIFQFILEEWGADALSSFLAAFRSTTNVARVTTDVLGLNLAAFEMAWRDWLGYPVDTVPQLQPTPTTMPFVFPTPTYMPPG